MSGKQQDPRDMAVSIVGPRRRRLFPEHSEMLLSNAFEERWLTRLENSVFSRLPSAGNKQTPCPASGWPEKGLLLSPEHGTGTPLTVSDCCHVSGCGTRPVHSIAVIHWPKGRNLSPASVLWTLGGHGQPSAHPSKVSLQAVPC